MTKADESPTKITLPTKLDAKNSSAYIKVFKVCNSRLTDLIAKEGAHPVYSIFCIVWIFLGTRIIWNDYINDGSFYFCYRTFRAGFSDFHYGLAYWCLAHALVFLIYYGFQCWCCIYVHLHNTAVLRLLVNAAALLLYALSQLAFAYLAGICAMQLLQGFATRIALVTEAIRLLMKMHAFVRTNTPKALKELAVSNDVWLTTKRDLPSLKRYLYFLLAPTLIYRDAYPRASTPNIRFSFVVRCLLEIVGLAFLLAFLYELYIYPRFRDFGKSPVRLADLVDNLFAMLMPGSLILLSWFYLILHAVQNLFAELLHFGDRRFYFDWWNSCDFTTYFRRWNIIVQDWLYVYVYCDFTKYVCSSRLAGVVVVFTTSALVHETMLTLILRIFLPTLYCLFGVLSLFLMYIRFGSKRLGNIFLWLSLVLGMSLSINMYAMEYYARENCAKPYRNVTDYLIPNMWNCMTGSLYGNESKQF